ncbi:MAG: S8 family serine peptidase [Candidatus Omnitrophica bacterium]|nr:S8 family serine peptidase [Candidatus Omnitrophota bacterium]
MINRTVVLVKLLLVLVFLFFSLSLPALAGEREFLPDFQSDPSIPIPPESGSLLLRSKMASSRVIVKVRSGKTVGDLKAFRAKNKRSAHKYRNTFAARVDHQGRLSALRNERARYGRKKSADPKALDLDRRLQVKEVLVERMNRRALRAGHGRKHNAPALENVYFVEVPKGEDVNSVLKDYRSDPNVEYAQPDYEMKAFVYPETLPNDMAVNLVQDGLTWRANTWGQGYEDMWGLKIIKADKAWPLSLGAGVTVAVVDTGVDRNHPDLNGAMWVNSGEIPGNRTDDDGNGYIDDYIGWDFAGASVINSSFPDNDPADGHGHGTHVSGTIAARANNEEGISGVAPLATIMAVKGLDNSGNGYVSGLANAIKYAVDNGADIINCSWGGGASGVIADAVHYAESKGVVVVAAAGNSSADVAGISPGGIDSVITVSASDHNDKICDFSNFGDKVDVAAPGGESGYAVDNSATRNYSKASIVSLRSAGTDVSSSGGLTFYPAIGDAGARYVRALGTSMAAPHVSGVAALMLGRNGALNTDQVKSIIQSTAEDVNDNGPDVYFGYGRLDARKACEEADKSPAIKAPGAGVFVKGAFNLLGTARDRFEVFWAPADDPGTRTGLFAGQGVTDGLLGVVDTSGMPEGQVIITLVMQSADRIREVAVRVNVDNVSQPPVLAVTDLAVVVGQANKFTVTASDTDDPATPQGTLTYSAAGLPTGASLDSLTGLFTWTPAMKDRGFYQVAFTVKDNGVPAHQVTRTVALTTVTLEEIALPAIDTSTVILKDDKVIWPEFRDEYYHLYSFDIRSGKLEQLTAVNMDDYNPDADNGRVVFSRRNNAQKNVPGWGSVSTSDIFLREADGSERQITNDEFTQTWAKISGDRVAWMDLRHSDPVTGQYDLYMRDIKPGGQETLISDNPFPQYMLSPLSGDLLAWFDHRNGNYDLFLYDMARQSQRQFTQSTYDDILPQLDADQVVWLRNVSDGTHIMYARENGPERVLVKAGAVFSSPRFDDNKVVWADGRDGRNYHIYLYDLSRETALQLTFSDGKDHIYPKVLGNWIMWMDYEYIQNSYGVFTERKNRLFEISFAPRLNALDRTSASRCSVVTLSGAGFGAREGSTARVVLNGLALPVQSWSDTEIEVSVPQGGASGLLTVETRGGTSNALSLAVTGNCALDTEAPVTTASGITEGWGGVQTVTLKARDYNSGVAAISYSLNGGQPNLAYTAPFMVNKEGVYDLKFSARDNAGNIEAVQVYPTPIRIDLSLPTGSVVIARTTPGENNTIDADLALYASDQISGMGLNSQMRFSSDNSQWTGAETFAFTRRWSFTSEDGLKTVYVKFKDDAGNWSIPYSAAFLVDDQPPVTTVSGFPASGWARELDLKFQANDAGSGVGAVLYSLDGAATFTPLQCYSSSCETYLFLNIPGTYNIRYYALDNAGHREQTRTLPTLSIDRTPPEGTLAINGGVAPVTSLNVTLALTAFDIGGSGAGPGTMVKVSNDRVTWVEMPFQASLSWTLASGLADKTVYAVISDRVGNQTELVARTMVTDVTAPVTTTVVPLDWTNQPLALTAVDDISGVQETRYSIDGGLYLSQYVAPLVLADGIYRLKYQSVDRAGNVETLKTAERDLKVDRMPPVGSVSFGRMISNANSLESLLTWVNVNLSAEDAFSGVSQVRLSSDNVGWHSPQAYQTTVLWPEAVPDGTRQFYVKFKDGAGNWSTASSCSVTIDHLPPFTYFRGVPMMAYWVNVAELKVYSSDAGLGVDKVYYSLNGSQPDIELTLECTGKDCVGTIPLPEPGIYNLRYYAVDKAGHQESIMGWPTFEVERIPPTGTLLVNGGAAFITSLDVTLTLTVADQGGSGAGTGTKVKLSNDRINWTEKDFQASLPWRLNSASNMVYAMIRDKAGNEKELSAAVGFADTLAPETTALISADWTTEPQGLSASDDLSGVRDTEYSIDGGNTFVKYTGPIVLPDGVYRFKYRSTDRAGNVEALKTANRDYKVDRTPPHGSINYEGNIKLLAGGRAKDGSNGGAFYSVEVHLAAADNLSGIRSVRFSDDYVALSGELTFQPEMPWPFPVKEGPQRFYARFKDGAGNWSVAASCSFVLDVLPPKSEVSINRGAPFNGWSRSANVTILAHDLASTPAAIYYSIDGSDPDTMLDLECYGNGMCTGIFDLTEPGVYNLRYFAVDASGNREQLRTFGPIGIDTTPPTGVLTIGGAASLNVDLNFNVADQGGSGSGPGTKVRLSNDRINWVERDFLVSMAWTMKNDTGTVYAIIRDKAGNETELSASRITQKITPQRVETHSFQNVNMTFSVPYNAVASKLFVTCDAGLTIGLGTVANICNRWQTLNLPPNTNQPMAFRVTNRTGRVLKAVPSFYIYKADRPNYANGVSGEITVNPNSGL